MSKYRVFSAFAVAGVVLMFTAILAGCEDHEGQRIDEVAVDKLTVYKSPQCGCCQLWIDYLETNGFKVATKNTDNLQSVKQRFGVERPYQSCHTAVSAGGNYVFEGHIPADIIRRFLEGPPDEAKGLTVPGMPPGSPGMETGGAAPPYDVLLLNMDGTVSVYATVDPNRS